MSITPGTKLGQYEVLEAIGAGGMGEVYRARDAKLGRDVAIKVLPQAFSEDRERVERFEREARLLARLNHPNIAILHGIEEVSGRQVLVMELVEGETLAERLLRGAIPVTEAIDIAIQIAEALEEAHERGIVHRDLKPDNVKLTPDGKVKVLDFGLAKVFAEKTPDVDSSRSPTIVRDATRAGMILGTAAYMSAEQAKGKSVDRRADIWAFGCVFYEMVTSMQPFVGDTVTEILAAVVKDEPDWSALPPSLSPHLRDLLVRCLRKDPRERVRDMGDVRIALKESGPHAEAASDIGRRTTWLLGVALVLVGVALGSVATWSRLGDARRGPGMKLTLGGEIVAREENFTVAVSSDGLTIAYIAEGTRQIRLRRLDALESRALEGTANARSPFFSPDGLWLGFNDRDTGALKKISVAGGTPVTLCRASGGGIRGAVWGTDGWIYFAQPLGLRGVSPLLRVRDSGGQPEVVLEEEGYSLAAPVIPPGRQVLFFHRSLKFEAFPPPERTQIAVLDLGTGQTKTVLEGHSFPAFLPTGYLLATSPSDELTAYDFDLEELRVSGPGKAVLTGVRPTEGHFYAVAENGTLIAPRSKPLLSELLWVDNEGANTPVTSIIKNYRDPVPSPDGTRIAVRMGEKTIFGLWIHELARNVQMPITFGQGSVFSKPVWTPDGQAVIYGESGAPDSNVRLYLHPLDGLTDRKLLLTHDATLFPISITPDGKTLLLERAVPGTGWDVHAFDIDGSGKLQSLIQTSFNERTPMVSPDGGSLAYVSDKSGRDEIYARPLSGTGREVRASTRGGLFPRWGPDGDKLFYREGETIMAVRVDTARGGADPPRKLFELEEGILDFTVSPDGRFLARRVRREDSPLTIWVITNLFENLP